MKMFIRRVLDFSFGRKRNNLETENNSETARMTNSINIMGFQNPEKVADGRCPHCGGFIDLWVTTDGFELSTDKCQNSRDVKTTLRHCRLSQSER